MPTSADIQDELQTHLSQSDWGDGAFERLAHRVFDHQYLNNPSYRNYCDAKGVSPDDLEDWQKTPSLPTDAYKSPEYPVISFPISEKKHTFQTSGTTTETKGEHHFPSLDLYEESIRRMWISLEIPRADSAVFLTPPPSQAPQSSLSHMMGVLEPIVADNYHLDADQLKKLAAEEKPLIILGTALAFLDLFERMSDPLTLPEGSHAMETGGYKGTNRQLSKTELYALFEEKLGLRQSAIINEYSMTELSSQFYTHGIGNPHQGPPWTRIRVIDPITGDDANQDTPGYLVIYDLANLHSCMAVQTQDIAIAHSDRSFTLLGRDPSALPRGCSRAAHTHSPLS